MLKRLFVLVVCGLFVGSFQLSAQSLDEAKSLINEENYSEAVQVLNTLIGQEDDNPEFYYWKGTALFESGDFSGADNAFKAGIKAKNRYPYNHVGIARLLIKEGKSYEADEILTKKALYYDKGRDVNVKFAVAAAYIEDKEFKKAEVFLLQGQSEAPDNPASYIALGDYYYQKDVAELALDQYMKAIDLAPEFVPGYTRVGQMKIESQEYDEGAKYLNKAIEIDPEFAPSYKYRGELWLKAKRFEQARDDYKKYVELAGNDLAARIRYASFLFLSENYTEAISELETLKQDTITNVMRRLTGMAYHKMGDQDKAKANMDDYFANIKPEYTIKDDYEAYGRIMLAQGNLEEADKNFDKMVSFDAENVSIYEKLASEFEALGKAARKAKDKETALENYGKEAHYRELYLDNSVAKSLKLYYTTAKANFYSENYEKAEQYFDEVLNLKNDYTPPYQFLMQMAYKKDQAIKAADTSAVSWEVKGPAERVVATFGEKAPEELKKSERNLILTSYEILANYNFDPNGDANYNCGAAKPFIDKILAIDPEYARIKPLTDYCDQF